MNINKYATGIKLDQHHAGIVFVNDNRFNRLTILYSRSQGRIVNTTTSLFPLFYEEGANDKFKIINHFLLSLN